MQMLQLQGSKPLIRPPTARANQHKTVPNAALTTRNIQLIIKVPVPIKAPSPTRSLRHKRQQLQTITNAAPTNLVPFMPIKELEGYKLRLINPHTVAKTTYTKRDEGFLALGSYMSGANESELKMVETQPIIMSYYPDGTKTMQVYVLPRDKTIQAAALPQPTDPTVTLDAAGGELVAVYKFEGYATEEACKQAVDALKASLARDKVRLGEQEQQGMFRLAQYGPIHSLTPRMNEIWLSVIVGLR